MFLGEEDLHSLLLDQSQELETIRALTKPMTHKKMLSTKEKIYFCISDGDLDTLKYLVESGYIKDPYEPSESWRPPMYENIFHASVSCGYFYMVEYLASKYALTSFFTENNHERITLSAYRSKNPLIINFFLNHGMIRKNKIVDYAVMTGDHILVDYMIKIFEKMYGIYNEDDNALLICIDSKNINIFAFLLKKKGKLSQKEQELFFLIHGKEELKNFAKIMQKHIVIRDPRIKKEENMFVLLWLKFKTYVVGLFG